MRENKCENCGSCCYRILPFMRVHTRLADNISPELTVEHNGVLYMKTRGDGSCIALDTRTNQCAIHGRHPEDCRSFSSFPEFCAVLRRARMENPTGKAAKRVYVIVQRAEDENHVTLVTTDVVKARKTLWGLAKAEGLTRPEQEKHVMSGHLCGFSEGGEDDYLVELFEETIT